MIIDNLIPSVAPLVTSRIPRILFVCLGNICRSPAAEGVLNEIIKEHNDTGNWIVDSAGTGNYLIGELPDSRMRAHARRRGIELTHHCRQVCGSDFDNFDLIIPMDASNEKKLRALASTVSDGQKIIPMAKFFDIATRYDYVPDPYCEGAEGFELVLDLLQDGCLNLYDTVKAAVNQTF